MNAESPTSLMVSIRNGAISLGLFAVLTATAISLTFVSSSDSIAANKAAAKAKALAAVVPANFYDQSLLSAPLQLPNHQQLNVPESALGYAVIKSKLTQAVILPVIARDGYSGDISLLVGIDAAGTIKGVRVIEHKETPGLGDKIERKKSVWIDSFMGHSLTNTTAQEWAVIKDGGEFDGFTGATITPRAVVNAVHQSLLYHHQHQQTLYSAAQEN